MSDPIKATINGALVYQAQAPMPLSRKVPDPEPYPVDDLGDVLGAAARAIHDRVQAPLAMCAQSVLAAAALAVQGLRNVKLPHGQASPLSLFCLTIAESGERKSQCDRIALGPINRRETALQAQYDCELPSFKNAKLAWEKAREAVLKKAKGEPNASALAIALESIGPEPIEPLAPLLTAPEPTWEGMCRVMQKGHASLGLFSDEGGGFVGGHGMSAEAKVRTMAGLNLAWDGKPIKRVRMNEGGLLLLSGRRLSLHLMLQTGIANQLLGDPDAESIGLLARLLIVAPKATAGTRFVREVAPETYAALQCYEGRLLAILEMPLPLAEGKRNELDPPALTFDADAARAFTGFQDHIEGMLGDGGELRPIKAFGSKLAEQAARIAGVLTLIDNPNAQSIDADTMTRAARIAEHYCCEALRLLAGASISEQIRRTEKVLSWLRTRGQATFKLSDIYQRGPGEVREAAEARKVVGILIDHGWLVPADPKAKEWRIVQAEAA
ncbi:MAG: DUF3987 domain-containing protein [Rhodospirillales bacterium]|nr:DUF3987 domain-containing protein [Rhodospirillales bacterium]